MSKLVDCTDCGAAISLRAPHCPQCGAPTGTGVGYQAVKNLQIVFGASAFVLFVYLMYSYSEILILCDQTDYVNSEGVTRYVKLFLASLIIPPATKFMDGGIDSCAGMLTVEKGIFIVWLLWIIAGAMSIFFDKIFSKVEKS